MEEIKREKIVSLITDFEDLANLTDSLFRDNFDIETAPLHASRRKEIPRIGLLKLADEEVKYQFHGNGCKFIFPKGEVVDFNYDTENWEYAGFTRFTLHEFFESKGFKDDSPNELEEELRELERMHIIYRPDSRYEKYKLTVKRSAP